MKKIIILIITLSSVLLLTACSNADELSEKTFKVMYPPVQEKEMENPSYYHKVMTLHFSDNIVVIDAIDVEGTYELNDDELVINLENENEILEFKFVDLQESDKDFSTYSTSISDVKLEVKNPDQPSRLENIASKFIKDMPIEIIEE